MTTLKHLESFEYLTRERDERLRILSEHADFLAALIKIDDIMIQMGDADEGTIDDLLAALNAAIPPSIVATRKEAQNV